MKMNKSSLILVVMALFPAGASSAQAQVPKLWGDVSPGSKRVGFRTFEVVDTTRTGKAGGPRRFQVALWYPAKKDNAAHMTFGDYVRLTGAGGPDNALAAFKQDLTAHGNTDAVIEQLLTSPVYAVHDAAPLERHSDVLVVALDQAESPYNQAMFAEFYASQGFAVMATASENSIDGPPAPGTPVFGLAKTQVADIQVALDALASDKNINTKHVGVVGHESGSRAAFLLLSDPRVTALMSMNGDIGNQKREPEGDWLADANMNFGRFKTSVMHVYETADSLVIPEFRVLQKLANTDRVFVHMGDGFRSVDFSTIGNAKGAIPGFQYGPATPDVLGKIDFMNRLMYGWLLTYISGDGSRFPSGLPKYIRIQRMTAGNAGNPS